MAEILKGCKLPDSFGEATEEPRKSRPQPAPASVAAPRGTVITATKSPKVWFTATEHELVTALLAGAWIKPTCPAEYKRIAVHMHNLRTKLAPHGVVIDRDSRLGYGLSAADHERLTVVVGA